jgi:hypothetical protein
MRTMIPPLLVDTSSLLAGDPASTARTHLASAARQALAATPLATAMHAFSVFAAQFVIAVRCALLVAATPATLISTRPFAPILLLTTSTICATLEARATLQSSATLLPICTALHQRVCTLPSTAGKAVFTLVVCTTAFSPHATGC